MTLLANVRTIYHDVVVRIDAGQDVSNPGLVTDLRTSDIDLHRVLDLIGPPPTEEQRLAFLVRQSVEILALVQDIDNRIVPAPAVPYGVIWTATYRGMQFTGANRMGASIQEGYGVNLTAVATDALGETDPTATQVLSSDNPAVVTVVDSGGGLARADITAGATAGLTANVVDTITDTDGHTVTQNFAITVLAGDATGATITASAPTPTP